MISIKQINFIPSDFSKVIRQWPLPRTRKNGSFCAQGMTFLLHIHLVSVEPTTSPSI